MASEFCNEFFTIKFLTVFKLFQHCVKATLTEKWWLLEVLAKDPRVAFLLVFLPRVAMDTFFTFSDVPASRERSLSCPVLKVC